MNTNLHDLSDDELDHLFSDAAEKMEIDFEPDSWSKMSQKLDAASGKTQAENTGLKRGLLLLLALLFMAGAYYLMKPSTDKVNEIQTNNKNNSEQESKETGKKDVSTSKVGTDNLVNNKKENLEQENGSEKDINTSASVTYENKKTENKAVEINPANDKNEILANKNKDISSKNIKNSIAKNENLANPLTKNIVVHNTKSSKINKFSKDKPREISENTISVETNLVAEKNSNFEKNKNEISSAESNILNESNTNIQLENSSTNISTISNLEENAGRLTLKELNTLLPKKAIFKASFSLPILAFDSPKVAPSAIPTSISFKKGLNLRVAFSPDFSVIPSNSFAKVGNNLAFLLEYRFNKHWSLQTGVIRSLKRYTATPEQYNWNTNWNKPTPLVYVDATCKMLDIPLNVRYDFTQKANSRWFMSSGFTSYVMLNELYLYNYEDNANHYIKYRELSTKTGNYPFSIFNYSIGYERQILRKLSFQAEPFIKIPLGEVGYGTVKLATIGVFFSAKYPINAQFRRAGN